jgi:tetratricopeptide (TPR) repeat protein/tRNA A-37 threonylcarbamoyl transferase component Bud32
MSGSPQAQPADDPVQPGETLAGRFRVLRRIAEGGMGVVYEAFDEKLKRRIALKCARGRHGRRLSPEVRLATELTHPNICKIYEIHTAETIRGPVEFLTMEFLDGPTLAQRLTSGPLPKAEARTIALQLCAGLAEAHRRSVVHGDLKTGNVILARDSDGSRRTVITDFGMARGQPARGARGGSPGYMAPELHAGRRTTIASDIYALGVILHELACGYRPAERAAMAAPTAGMAATATPETQSSPPSTQEAVEPLNYAQLPPLKSDWDPVLETCLQPNPARRYKNADEVLRALGPSRLRMPILLSAAAAGLAAIVAIATYLIMTAPGQTVRLDVAVAGGSALAPEARKLQDASLRELAHVKNTRQTALAAQPVRPKSTATHRLSAELSQTADKFTLHAVIQNLHSGAPVIEWSGSYGPGQIRYAPVALAGLVSEAFHLRPLTTYATLNRAALAPYSRGIDLLKDDSKIDEAAADFQAAAALDPDSALPFAGLAETQRRRFFLTHDKHWLAQASASLSQAEMRNPDCAEVHRIAAYIESDLNHREQAMARIRRAIEFQPPHPDAFRRLGQFYESNGQFAEALEAYAQARRLAPGDFRTYQDLGNLYISQSDFEQASKVLEQAVTLAPDRPVLRVLLAASYQDQGQFGEAEAQLREALKQQPSPDALFQLAHVLMYEKKDQEAVPLLSQVAGLEPWNQFAWMYLGLAYDRTGKSAGARAAFEQGRSAAERKVSEEPGSGYNHGLLAYLCAQTGQPGRAEVEAAEAIQLSPRHSDTLWMAALAYERTGNRGSALKTLENAHRPLLEDLQRWPEAAALTADPRFSTLLSANKP